MAARFGLNVDWYMRNFGQPGRGDEIVAEAGIIPKTPTLTHEEWNKIQNFYLSSAPLALPAPKEGPKPIVGLPGFQVRKLLSPYPLPGISNITVDDASGALYVSDAYKRKLIRLGSELEIDKVFELEHGASHVQLIADGIRVTDVGNLDSSDDPRGSLVDYVWHPSDDDYHVRTHLRELKRPADAVYGDLNQDDREDVVLCEFGHNIGQLAWYELQQDGRYAPRVLHAVPGAIKAYIRDINGDSKPDIVAMFAQGEESIRAFINQGNGEFENKLLIQFPPSYGSTYFDLLDLDGDGDDDILHTCGDNGDYEPILKPYHGVRIFTNDGNNAFQETHFHQMHGCTKAIAHDFDGDGILDIATISFYPDFRSGSPEQFTYLRGTGNHTYKAYTMPEAADGRWLILESADIDHDGDQDLFLGAMNRGPGAVPEATADHWQKSGSCVLMLENTSVK